MDWLASALVDGPIPDTVKGLEREIERTRRLIAYIDMTPSERRKADAEGFLKVPCE